MLTHAVRLISPAACAQASMDKLVDTAVGLVEEGRLQQATQVLQQGIDLLTSTFPDRWAGGCYEQIVCCVRLFKGYGPWLLVFCGLQML
jgi:hypothetical protein